MWVLLGTSWPKLTIMSIFCGVMPKNKRHQRTVQKRKGIFMTLLLVNEYFLILVMQIVTYWHNQRQEYYSKAAFLSTYKSL